MLTLILTVCLASDPAQCREERVPTEAVLPMECTAAMNEWAVLHPWLTVQRWACRRLGRTA
ncbi:hypothetical protein [Xanthobacter sp.]|uniref:hypothetical protein n=1 Tax=Xanthobacter sp. TaxID=35809 RepID=UPI0025D97C88|nr:hypothetical protein [Xanthobacter sp.]